MLEAFGAILDASRAPKWDKCTLTGENGAICACWGPLGEPLGVFSRPLGPSGDHLERLGKIIRRLG
eukprot:8221480-Pyramimonas_sp.AAC.1